MGGRCEEWMRMGMGMGMGILVECKRWSRKDSAGERSGDENEGRSSRMGSKRPYISCLIVNARSHGRKRRRPS